MSRQQVLQKAEVGNKASKIVYAVRARSLGFAKLSLYDFERNGETIIFKCSENG